MDGPEAADPAVVVVEDETELAELFAEALTPEYSVTTVYDGEQALAAIDHTTDVVLLDRRLPKLHGDAVLRRLREAGYRCRVVMVTAVDPGIDIAGLPFEAYVTKPVGPSEITNVVDEQLLYATYETKIREYTRLRSQIELLREATAQWRLAEDERFARLCARAETVKADIEDLFKGHATAVSDPTPVE